MPNYVAHEYFGKQVTDRLSGHLQRAVEMDSEAFRSGLYGPDPLLFLPGGLLHSRRLHNHWREETAPTLQAMTEQGSAGEKSFAAGYLCHMVLDDCCHLWIHRWMREWGLSHRCLEVGLDWMILEKAGETRFPVPRVEGRERISRLAAQVIHPIRPLEYRMGLASMGAVCSQMTKAAKLYRRKLGADYDAPLHALERTMDQAVDSAVMLLTHFTAGELLRPRETVHEGLLQPS